MLGAAKALVYSEVSKVSGVPSMRYHFILQDKRLQTVLSSITKKFDLLILQFVYRNCTKQKENV